MDWLFLPALALAATLIVAAGKVKRHGSPESINFGVGVFMDLFGVLLATAVPIFSAGQSDSGTIAGLLMWFIILASVLTATKQLTRYYPDRPPRF